jgi:hypothetical protein
MPYQDMFGKMHDGDPPSFDATNGQALPDDYPEDEGTVALGLTLEDAQRQVMAQRFVAGAPLVPVERSPGRLYYDILDQDEIWRDANGVVHQLVDMAPSYRANVIGFLKRRAEELLEGWVRLHYLSGAGPQGELAQDAFDAELTGHAKAQPQDWLEQRPLVRRLRSLNAQEEG